MAIDELREIEHELGGRSFVAEALGRSPSWATKTVKAAEAGRPVRFDLETERRIHGLGYVVRRVRQDRGESPRAWLLSPNAALGDLTPIDVLRSGDYEKVIRAAKEGVRVHQTTGEQVRVIDLGRERPEYRGYQLDSGLIEAAAMRVDLAEKLIGVVEAEVISLEERPDSAYR